MSTNVLLVEPAHPKDWGKYNQYMGLLKIGAYYRSKGDSVEYVKGGQEPSLTMESPDKIYIASIFSYWEKYYVDAIRFYREMYPKAEIIFGGIYAINAYDRVLKWEDKYDITIQTQFPQVQNMVPDITLTGDDYAAILTSRGCPNNCTYCSVHNIYGMGWQPRGIDDVMEEVEIQLSRGAKTFAIYDDSFLFKAEEHSLPLLERIVKLRQSKKYHNFFFSIPSGFQAGHMNLEIAHMLKKAGFKERLALGMESVNPEILRKMNRAGWSDSTKVYDCVKIMQSAGFTVKDINVFFMCGLPYQTIEDMLATAVYIGQMGCYANMQRFAPIPGTVDFDGCGLDAMTCDMELTEGDKFLAEGVDFTEDDLHGIKKYVQWQNCGLRYSGVNMFEPKHPVIERGLKMANEIMSDEMGW